MPSLALLLADPLARLRRHLALLHHWRRCKRSPCKLRTPALSIPMLMHRVLTSDVVLQQALAGAAGVNFCTGLWCMICASIYTANMGGAPSGANFSYAALWLCWILSWIVAGICGAAHGQGDANAGMATGPKEEIVVVTAV